MGKKIDLKNFLIQLLFNIPVYVSLVSALESFLGVLDCLLEHQSVIVPLKR